MKKIISELRNIVLARPLDFLLWYDGKLELKAAISEYMEESKKEE